MEGLNPKEFPLKKEHHESLSSIGCDIEAVIELRQWLHQNPEGKLQEFNTAKKIYETLLSYGIDESCMKKCATTGLVVDIQGQSEVKQIEGGPQIVALRADIDGLFMSEDNKELPYTSQTQFAHMCGHDGHTATLLAAAQALAKQRSKIPQDCTVRLLFQPAEEGPGGALPMIKEGCLDGVDEVYGFHNIPIFSEGEIVVSPGIVCLTGGFVDIKIKGKGGHGSAPHMFNDVISAACQTQTALHTISSRMMDPRDKFTFTICTFNSGSAANVLPDEATMTGTIRCGSVEILHKVEEKIRTIVETLPKTYGCTGSVNFIEIYPPVVNAVKETQHVIRVAEKHFGKEMVSSRMLPLPNCEDFSYYLQEKPGCFFFLGTFDAKYPKRVPHQSNYDYNDAMIASGAYFWVRLIEDRFSCSIIN